MEQKDINATYQEELAILASKPPPESSGRSADQKQEDYYKNFRTNVSRVGYQSQVLTLSTGSSGLDHDQRPPRRYHPVRARRLLR